MKVITSFIIIKELYKHCGLHTKPFGQDFKSKNQYKIIIITNLPD